MKVLLRLVAFIIVGCYFNLCSAATYIIPDTEMTMDIPDTYRVITRQDTDRLVEILNDVYNVKNNKKYDSQKLLEEADKIRKSFDDSGTKMICISSETLFDFYIACDTK